MSSQNSTLTPSQTHALAQLQDLTNTTGGDDSDELIGVLTAVDWNVERAAEVIFGGSGSGSHAGPSTSTPRYEEFDVDDSEQSLLRDRDRDRDLPRHSPSLITQVLTYPLHILSSLFRFIFTLLRLRNPIPYIPFLSLNPWSRGGGWNWTNLGRGGWSGPRAGRGGVERWIRELEEETGGVCANSTTSSSDFTDVGDSTGIAGPSRITPRHTSSSASNGANGRPLLPPFASGSYDSILRLCSSPQNPKIGFIVLVSSEHTPDDAVFKNQTLANKELVDILSEEVLGSDEDELGGRNEEGLFICWGGDVVRDKDAYDASMKLGATTFPFVAFVALQGGRGFSAAVTGSSTTATTTPALTILSRHLGSSACTSQALTTHLTSVLLPRVKPYLRRVKVTHIAKEREEALARQERQRNAQTQSRERERERELREAQDRAFEASKMRDYERLKKRMEEEKEKADREARMVLEQERELEQERKEQERVRIRHGWRVWFRDVVGSSNGPDVNGQSSLDSNNGTRNPDDVNTVRIAIRLPDGKRLMKRFGKDDTLDLVYAWVDAELGSSSTPASGGSLTETQSYSFPALHSLLASLPSSSSNATTPQQQWWGFTLHTSYPRKAIPWTPNVSLNDVEVLSGVGGGGQIVVEMSQRRNASRNGKGKGKAKREDEDDGYVTESSDEE